MTKTTKTTTDTKTLVKQYLASDAAKFDVYTPQHVEAILNFIITETDVNIDENINDFIKNNFRYYFDLNEAYYQVMGEPRNKTTRKEAIKTIKNNTKNQVIITKTAVIEYKR